MKLGEIVIVINNYNFTKFHQIQMKNKKVLLIAHFFVQNFNISVESWKLYIVHMANRRLKTKFDFIPNCSSTKTFLYLFFFFFFILSGNWRFVFYEFFQLLPIGKNICICKLQLSKSTLLFVKLTLYYFGIENKSVMC